MKWRARWRIWSDGHAARGAGRSRTHHGPWIGQRREVRLDLLAVGTAAGRSPQRVLGEISCAATPGEPLAAELAVAVTEIECGTPQRDAIARLRDRVPGAGLGALASALERSRRFGSPLADQLHEQASALRRDARRRIEERAARAAPKIQLVVALVLVPSVLLMILAGLIANSDALFGAL